MTIDEFVRLNKETIDKYIKGIVNFNRLTNEERKLWVSNDEYLYNWAKVEGVRI